MILAPLPRHVAISIEGWTKRPDSPMAMNNMIGVLALAIERNIPVLTVSLLPYAQVHDPERLDSLIAALETLASSPLLSKYQVKVTVVGTWYDLPGRVVEPIKHLIEATKEYDQYFLNLTVNYGGQEEIVEACKLLARQVAAGKLDADSITKAAIKENLYTSSFIPPDLIIRAGSTRHVYDVLLWDSVNAIVVFADSPWTSFGPREFWNAVEWWQRQKR